MRTLALLMVLVAVCAQGQDWVVEWNRAQRQRPSALGPVAVIPPRGEPGTPLVVHGRVLRSDGVTPAPAVVVFVYQTDAKGLYNEPGSHGWRLRGWARSGSDGRFELRTIRPGSYPKSRFAAHIHVTIDGPQLPRRYVQEIQFADDPLLPEKDRRFGLPVTTRAGVQHVSYTIRISEEGRF